jgi:hypothetical protein
VPPSGISSKGHLNKGIQAMPMRAELPIATARTSSPPSALDKVAALTAATIKSPEFLMVVLFSLVGLWLTFYFINFFPDYAAMSTSLGVYP